MTDNVVPFGKYKGQTVADIAARDPAYLQWLLQQNWFIEKFSSLVVNVTNVGPASEETPAHNAMQVRFLDADYRFAFVWAAYPGLVECEIEGPQFETVSDVMFYVEGKAWDESEVWFTVLVEIKPSLGDDFPVVLRQIKKQRERLDTLAALGKGPSPHRCSWKLLVGEYSGVGATLDQMRKVFAADEIGVVMASDIKLEGK